MFNSENGTSKSLWDSMSFVKKLLQHSCQDSYQEITTLLPRDYSTPDKKMIEYLNFFLLCTLVTLLCYLHVRTKRYITLLKMAEKNNNNFISSGYDAPQSDSKRQKLLECILTGNSKLYLGKVYREERINKLGDKLFSNYEAKVSGQMVKSLGKLITNMYSMGACAALGISNQDALSEDLENDRFLNSALQRFTCELYYRFGSFLAPLRSRVWIVVRPTENDSTRFLQKWWYLSCY